MAEDFNSYHRQGDACGCYSVNGMARLVIGVAIGMGVCPIGWLLCGGNVDVMAWVNVDVMGWVASRSKPPRLVVDLSPIPSLVSSFLSGVQSSVPGWYLWIVECWKCGGGRGVARSPILALYAGGSSIRATDIFESMVAVWFDIMSEDGCCFAWPWLWWNGGRRIPGDLFIIFSLAFDCSMGKFLSCQFSTNQCFLLYSFHTHTYHFIMSSFFIFVIQMSCTFVPVYYRRFTILIISTTTI
jgi:hypothetical protein